MKALAGVGVLAGLGLVAGEALRSRRVLTELHTAQEQAVGDPLTGLRNRAGMGEAVKRLIGGSDAAALLLIDLDKFKEINDTHGHAAGDEVLVEVARRIGEVLDHGVETAGRHGGDEFSVLTPARPDPWLRARAAAVTAAVSGPLTLSSGAEVVVRASVGTAVTATSPSIAPEMAARQLWEAADQAMYRNKAEHHRTHSRWRRWTR